MKKIEKCPLCKREIRFIKNDFVVWNEKYYHYECLKVYSGTHPKKLSLEKLEEVYSWTKVEYKDLPIKYKLYLFLQKQYDIVILTDALINKLDEIFNGTYKDMTEKVGVEDLLEMWELQIDKLNTQNYYNTNKGKIMSGGFRLAYDLAIILSNFKNYKSWQSRVEQDKKEIEEQNKKPKIDFNKLRDNKKEDISNKKENGDLDWLVDF